MHELFIGTDPYSSSDIKSGAINLANSLSGDELSYDTMVFSVEVSEENGLLEANGLELIDADGELLLAAANDVSGYKYGVPVIYRKDGNLVQKMYIEGVERTGRNAYLIKCISAVGLLSKSKHYGGIYNTTPFAEVVADIIGNEIAYKIDPVFDEQTVSGWLPIASRRDNLHQLLFAMSAIVKKDEDGDVYITALYDDVSSNIEDENIYLGGSIKYGEAADAVSVTEHTYASYEDDNQVVLFDGAVDAVEIITPMGRTETGAIILFDNPCHDLVAEGTTILESGVNYAVIAPSRTAVLSGKEYTHQMRDVVLPQGIEIKSTTNVKSCKDATLVNILNVDGVASRLFSFYSSAETVSMAFVPSGETPADTVTFTNPYGESSKGIIASMDINVSETDKATSTIVTEFNPPLPGNFYQHFVLLTGSGTWAVPPEAQGRIRAILIGGGQGATDGKDGQDGDTPVWRGSSNGYEWTYGGLGGEAGEKGEGGNILISSLNAESGQIFSYSCGMGGHKGTKGTDTIFGELSSANGDHASNGFTNVFDGLVYGGDGDEGIKGGNGGSISFRGIKAEDAGEFIGGRTGAGYSYSSSVFTSIDAYGAGGSGAAYGNNGEDATDSQGHGSGTIDNISDAGNGVNAIAPPSAYRFGFGGNGGHGGAGGGAGAFAESSNYQSGAYYTSHGYKNGGIGGLGSAGTDGANGCVIVFY